MAAAAAGKSTLGIPQSVGREFMGYGNKPKYSTGGTMGGGAAGSNAEYRHDPVKKKRNPQTRGSAGAYAMISALRNPGQSSAEMKGGKYHNPHRGGY
jgi:hypothetical protein